MMLLPCQEKEPDNTDGINPWMLLEDMRSSGPPSSNASNGLQGDATVQMSLLLHSCFLMIMRDLWKVRIKEPKKLGSFFHSFYMNIGL
ncbi:hypothetical protein F2Q70_00027973 [Brassica cretica]|uniref:Uncharacterized protein n=2 Tax=Brassica cretica TaxID=69181 RepID=A0A3N6T6X2_BRACR|nr:hypothetical protein F2Q68_00027557 [Brassica cretica]KAF2602367.1 hypothetical protein F2Q70_00027973 [Brassica cretica]KAF3579158.1 hypothetical protein DY000_02034531 [Brassica cretica]